LEAAKYWFIFTHPLGPEKSATPPIPSGRESFIPKAQPAGREGGGGLASYGLDTEE